MVSRGSSQKINEHIYIFIKGTYSKSDIPNPRIALLMELPHEDLVTKFKRAISFKIYIVSLIIVALFLDLIVVLSMAFFTTILHRGIILLDDPDLNVVQIILGISSALYVVVYIVLAIIFIYMILKETKVI